ncbi:MAG: diaminopimelate decarboxylase [Chthoniobacterales bacterium]
MHQFHYQNNSLYCEKVSLTKLATEHGTPLYVYSATTIRENFRRLDKALGELDRMVCFAMKANSNLSVINLLAKEGSGFDIVSGGELFRVLKAGGRADRCTFAGVGKTEDEIAYALREGIYCFNVESEAELETLNRIAGSLGIKAPIAVRVNPNVDAQTHKYISTGKSHNKFGVGIDRAEEVYAVAAALPHLKIKGVQTHIGSQILQSTPFAEALGKLSPLVEKLKATYNIEFFSFGGGLGIVYKEALASGDPAWWLAPGKERITPEEYAQTIVPTLKKLGLRILFEPGRFLVGNAGVLLNKVLYVKQTPAKHFVVVDGAMNDLIRPALYEGWHEIVPLTQPAPGTQTAPVDIVGPVCESGDFFAQDRELPPLKAGDLIALMSAGAYGFVMSSTYNSRPLLAEILVDGDKALVARARQPLEEIIRGEHLP